MRMTKYLLQKSGRQLYKAQITAQYQRAIVISSLGALVWP